MRAPLDTVFGVDSNVRVLRVLAAHGGPLSSSDITRRAKLSKTGTRQGLISLEECGAIVTEGSGHSRLHRFNHDYYLAPQIKALFGAESVSSRRCSMPYVSARENRRRIFRVSLSTVV
ncbi:helix-turn-helix domain-containing protein [Rhizobium sp.]|uniref:helix-turn-helix domain-containing protein n=1 Tax=Rhizobium sp. TaxID=391 RepID=UPI00389B0F45